MENVYNVGKNENGYEKEKEVIEKAAN